MASAFIYKEKSWMEQWKGTIKIGQLQNEGWFLLLGTKNRGFEIFTPSHRPVVVRKPIDPNPRLKGGREFN